MRNLILEHFPRRENEKDEAWDRRIRSKYVDVCRFLLPAASLANVGMTANARVLENMIRKMLSHELVEVPQIGEKVKEVAKAETPTLVKYADAVPYLVETVNEFAMTPPPFPLGEGDVIAEDWCTLISLRQRWREEGPGCGAVSFWRDELCRGTGICQISAGRGTGKAGRISVGTPGQI